MNNEPARHADIEEESTIDTLNEVIEVCSNSNLFHQDVPK
jgi:hypothetical protein